jgi:hypothetical protein
MAASDEAVVRRFYEQMCNERKNEIAPELFTPGHQLHDPQVTAGPGPDGIAETVSVYQRGVDGHWGSKSSSRRATGWSYGGPAAGHTSAR